MATQVVAGTLTALTLIIHGAWACEPAIIPNPASLQRGEGAFPLSRDTAIVAPAADAEARRIAQSLAERLNAAGVARLRVMTGDAREGAINVRRNARSSGGDEAYRLEVRPNRIDLEARATAGLRHAATTLRQLACREASGEWTIPAVAIEDAPAFAWRGVMLDSARHYQSPEFIRRYLEAMALHKLNVLHWHLTDDQAWRLEIRKYPRLTSVGAWRVPAGAAARSDIDPATGKPRLYGGFYTQQQVRALVAHAAGLGITIVPEIDMPGHATAAHAAYPSLAATGQAPAKVPADWGVYPNVYSLEESTFAFLEDVLAEVIALFPGPYIHIGGDEVQKEQWLGSPRARARMRELGIADAAGLQPYFTNRIGRFLEARGRRLVGWDEILEGHLPRSAVVMSWRGVDGALAAAAKGHDTVLAPDPTLYFDNRQGTGPDEPPGRLRVLASLESVYRFEPMPPKLAEHERKHVLGLQGNVWTEHIRTEERAGWMTFPRAAAIAELGWSPPARRDWRDFVRRVAASLPRYEAIDMPYADSAFAVEIRRRDAGSHVQVELSTQSGHGDIRYSIDGNDPTVRSPRYEGPIALEPRRGESIELRAASFDGERMISRARASTLRGDGSQRRSSHELRLCGNAIALALEDDAPLRGARAVFAIDIQSPCWIFPQADLTDVAGVAAAVGQLPFNFQIGDDVKKITFPEPSTAEGELVVRLGGCDGEVLARLPLAPASRSDAVTTLAQVAIAPRPGRHDLCLRFAQRGVDPMWAIDWIELIPRARASTP